MEYKNIRMPELKSLARDRGLRNYSQMRKAELVALLQNNPPPGQSRASAAPTPRTRPPLPPPTQTWEPITYSSPGARPKKEQNRCTPLPESVCLVFLTENATVMTI